MSGVTTAEELSGDGEASRRLVVMLAAVSVVVVAAVAGGWVLSRPPPLEQLATSFGECFRVSRSSEFATYGSLRLENRSGSPVTITDLRLLDARGLAITGVPMLVPMLQQPIGNQAGYPPTRRLDAPGVVWAQQRPVARGVLPPAEDAGPRNLVIGLRLQENAPDPSFGGVELTYKTGWRSYTWHSTAPVIVSTTGATC